MESEKNITTIKPAVQTTSGSLHHKIFMGMLGENPSIQMVGLGSSVKYKKNRSIVAEALEEYPLYLAEASYEDSREQSPMVLVELGREIQGSENAS